MSTSHSMHPKQSAIAEVEINRTFGTDGTPCLKIMLDRYDSAVVMHLTEEQLAAIAEVLTEDQDTRPIECGTCEGEGVVLIGHDPDTRLDEGDPNFATCPVCDGECKVPRVVFRDDLNEMWPDEEDARKILENDAETMQLSKGGQ